MGNHQRSRLARSDKYRKDVGDKGRDGIRGLVYRPTTGEVAPVGLMEAHIGAAKTVGVNLFTVAQDGQATAVVEKSKCYVTTATCAALGLPDDCEELQTLRWYRDEVLLRDPAHLKDVEAYYTSAPAVVAAIDALPEAQEIYAGIYRDGVAPALNHRARSSNVSRYREGAASGRKRLENKPEPAP